MQVKPQLKEKHLKMPMDQERVRLKEKNARKSLQIQVSDELIKRRPDVLLNF